METAMTAMVESIINHVALPPRLPSRADPDLGSVGLSLIDRLIEAVRQMIVAQPEPQILNAWEAIRRSLQTCRFVHTNGKLNNAQLLIAIRELQLNDLIILHISEQNAGLTLRRYKSSTHEDLIVFEAFEVSARSKDVLASKSTLQRDFPGSAVSLPFLRFSEPPFQENLATFLEKAGLETLKEFAPRAFKSDTTTFEVRDSVDPAIIIQILMPLLEAIGTRESVPLLRKRVSDDVSWGDGAFKPWRRSPMWLVLRVSIQRYLSLNFGSEIGRLQYKLLICLVLSQLLKQASDLLPIDKLELIHLLRAKLCRRLTKLEIDMNNAAPTDQPIYASLLRTFDLEFKTSVKIASRLIDSTFEKIKTSQILGHRQIRRLPFQASDRDMNLRLHLSGRYLTQILEHATHSQSTGSFRAIPPTYKLSEVVKTKPGTKFARCFMDIAVLEENLHDEAVSSSEGQQDCIYWASKIQEYLIAISSIYEHNPEQKSIMIISLLEMWVALDKCALIIFPLLSSYSPWFTPKLLDVLQLSRERDMIRAQQIRDHLEGRLEQCTEQLHIFSDPGSGCFAQRYYDESVDSQRLKDLRTEVEGWAETARAAKEQEWQEKSLKYEDLARQALRTSCICKTDVLLSKPRRPQCVKCELDNRASRIRIQGLEHPLPSDEVQAKAVIFEMACPSEFAKYREATWAICSLAFSSLCEDTEHIWLLTEYSELRRYAHLMPRRISMGSKKKSWMKTHFSRNLKFPVSLQEVYHPNGLRYVYLDTLKKTRPSIQLTTPTFAHHCELAVLRGSPLWPLRFAPELVAGSSGFSSYQVVASQGLCPSTINVHEFMAFQTLASGTYLRWPQLLIELGSANINFSTEATAILIQRLAQQIGPSVPGSPLGKIHMCFHNSTFCKDLLNQLEQRLQSITSNWRELASMETIITLILKVATLGIETRDESVALLIEARLITHKWTTLLRAEVMSATSAEVAQRSSTYALWAAILCRRTFEINRDWNTILSPDEVQCYVEVAITIQDNLVKDPFTLDTFLKNALVRDFKTVSSFRDKLRISVENSPISVVHAIKAICPIIGGEISALSYSGLKFLQDEQEWWIEILMPATMYSSQLVIHVHLLEGHLLLMGQSTGRLPPQWRSSSILKELFPDQNLHTYPSQMPGMTYMLAIGMHEQQIHLGFQNDELTLRTWNGHTMLAYVPRTKFGHGQNADLPQPLLENCVHWLDLNSGILEIRQCPHIWRSKLSNWNIRITGHTTGYEFRAYRRNSSLIDVNSDLFRWVGRLFANFEEPHMITVLQPRGKSRLSVELRALGLSFSVNHRGLLESRQLKAELDVDQDAGTWYGLVSKIVLRTVIQTEYNSTQTLQRSIIVPMGNMKYKKIGPHVMVNVENNGSFARFSINTIMGRLDCPAEPRLLYLKAMYHAYTSFLTPDPLTNRTGTEEALHSLSSGYCQPWSPLTTPQSAPFWMIAKLTPRRMYYPQHLRVMEVCSWDPHLTTAIQHESFHTLIESIKAKSDELASFSRNPNPLPSLAASGDAHLTLRSQFRRQRFCRAMDSSKPSVSRQDVVYVSRDTITSQKSLTSILRCVKLVDQWPAILDTFPDLIGIFANCPPHIGGFEVPYDRFLLSDLLNLDIFSHWGSLVKLSQTFEREDKYRVMFIFAVVAFTNVSEPGFTMIRTILAYAFLRDLKRPITLPWQSYSEFKRGDRPSSKLLSPLIQQYLVPYPEDERSILKNAEFTLSSKQLRKLHLAQKSYEKKQEAQILEISENLVKQWPCPEPSFPSAAMTPLINMENAIPGIRLEWSRLFQNLEFEAHLSETQIILHQHSKANLVIPPMTSRFNHEPEILTQRRRGGEVPKLPSLLRKPSFVSSASHATDGGKAATYVSINTKSSRPRSSAEAEELQRVVDRLKSSKSIVRQQYGEDLHQSLKALRLSGNAPSLSFPVVGVNAEIEKASSKIDANFALLVKALEWNEVGVDWLKRGGLWPEMSVVNLLEKLRSVSSTDFGQNMKELLINYAVSITILQRLYRIQDAEMRSNKQRLSEETQNYGHTNWNPLDCPDWLLLELDANLLLRPTQLEVANATISPSSGANSVLQMNMGQGKTSCIMPMAASVLADRNSLMRVIVPKALLAQTAQLLHSRLGGLIGRNILHIPFSRRTPTDINTTKLYKRLHNDIRTQSGVMLSLPEHILSFKLSGLQQLSDDQLLEAKEMIGVQSWIDNVSRDVIDEADSILAIRTQLIYPSGTQKTVDGHPHRWIVIETVLRHIEGHLWNLEYAYSRSIEVIRRSPGGFPSISFLRRDVEDEMIRRIVDDTYRGTNSIVPVDCPKQVRLLIRKFISDPRVTQDEAKSIRELYPDQPAVKQAIYLLRGLIVHRILLMSLKKRWNVQYGLHSMRDPIAVPYTAKGTPSEQAEWGHPDVAILFTCLAFYYQGLSRSQFRQTLEHVLKSDDPAQVYDRFAAHSNLPGSLHDWNSINVDDEAQLKELWNHARSNMTVVDYFLNNFVFPRHAKQFRMKLQASGWDLPLFIPAEAKQVSSQIRKQTLTTGFSGTNDWKRLLPLTISQEDLAGLAHTNAEVLTYLLQSRNRTCTRAMTIRGGPLSEIELLGVICQHGIRVLVDAGASILEMTNLDVAKAWLEIDTEAQAALYFSDDNKAMIYLRRGNILPLLASTYADDLSECLVYLDEAHTRGTDLKIPAHARGALTLGLGQTKDNTVQAAMRLRQLGTTQSVTFFAPPGVYQNIIDLQGKSQGSVIDSFDVICWLLEETCSGIEQLQPLFISQGNDYCVRAQAAIDNQNFMYAEKERGAYLASLRQMELQSLEKMYGLAKIQATKEAVFSCPEIKAFMNRLRCIRQAYKDNGTAVRGSALQEVEQERETAHEVENVREIQKPVHYDPLGWPGVHRDLDHFFRTGRVIPGSAGYEPAFEAMERTALGRKYRISRDNTSRKLFVSSQFTRTVKLPNGCSYDNLQRGVSWIVWSSVTKIAVMIIREEAEYYLSLQPQTSPTHLISYSAPITKKMLPLGKLTYHSIPSLPASWVAPMWLKIELGLFAGRLYFDYEEYLPLLDFLGIHATGDKIEEDLEEVPLQMESTEDFEAAEKSLINATQEIPKFARKPLTFLQEWTAMRRKGQDFAQTPIGYLCQGKPLLKSHPFFQRGNSSTTDLANQAMPGFSEVEQLEDDIEGDFLDDEERPENAPEFQDDFNANEWAGEGEGGDETAEWEDDEK